MKKAKLTFLMLLVAAAWCVQVKAQEETDRTKAYGYQFTETELAQYPQKTNLPTVYLEVYKTTVVDGKAQPIAEGETPELEDLNTVFGTKNDWYYNTQIIIRDDNGTIEERKEPTTVRGRGNSTWNIGNGAYKRPLRLKFPQKTALLGPNYANEKSWTLLANHYDATLIRNAMTNELGKLVGMTFCPAYKFVDLFVNNRYLGTYQISDQVQVAEKRVPIDEATGYFMEALAQKDGFLEDPYLILEMGNSWTNMYVNVKSPDPDVETSSGPTTDPKYVELKNHLDYVSGILLNGRFDRPENWRKYVDMESAVNAFIAMDMTGNYDGVVGNDYFYMNDINSPICFGPLWDFDLAWGGVVNGNNMTEKHFWEGESHPFGTLCQESFSDPYFVKLLYERWQQLYSADIASTLKARMAEIKSLIATSAEYNYKSLADGGAGEILNKGSWNDQNYENLEAAYAVMETFITKHIEYLNEAYRAQYDALGCKNLAEIPESGLFFDGTGVLWNGGENVYTYMAKASDVRVNGKLTVTVEGDGAYFSVYVKDSNNDKLISTYGGASLTQSKVLTQEDVEKLKANGYTFRIVVNGGTCSSVVLERPEPCDTHTYTGAYEIQTDGTYRRLCDVCGYDEADGDVYYKFTVYPESAETTEVYAVNWEPDETTPNAIATVNITPGLEQHIGGYNIVNTTKDDAGNKVCPDFILTDGHPYYSDDTFVATKATYSRGVTNDWGTMILPFNYQVSAATANCYQLSALTGEGNEQKLVLSPLTEVDAYVPVFFKRAESAAIVAVEGENVTVTKTTKKNLPMAATPVDGWTLKGVMETLKIDVQDGTWSGKNVYYISNNHFWHATGKVNIKPFRAYLESTEVVSSAIGLMVDDGETTGMLNVNVNDNANRNWYTLDGRLLNGRPTAKGIYIHNGRKEVVR